MEGRKKRKEWEEEALTDASFVGVTSVILSALARVAAHTVQAVSVGTTRVVEALVYICQGRGKGSAWVTKGQRGQNIPKASNMALTFSYPHYALIHTNLANPHLVTHQPMNL